jgi:acyl-coenzyme A synthetase/AMP-(fatty) acid ligase
LPAELVQVWQEAAPESVVENLYGPTELTIACALYRWDSDRSPDECEQGIVPIGEPYPGMQVLIADDELREVPTGEAGELLMAGPQVTLGYFKDPERTAKAFVVPPGREGVHYRTGDRVRRRAEGAPMVYLGRVDNQIKIQGYRVELGEVEARLREEGEVDVAIAIGWPRNASGADGIVGFVPRSAAGMDGLLERVRAHLPPYMQPSAVVPVDDFPLNPNGKVDRKALAVQLEERSS